MKKHIVMVAAENNALKQAKVGGIGDVVGESSAALARSGNRVTVLTPSYGHLHLVQPSRRVAELDVSFAGKIEPVVIYEITTTEPVPGLRHLVLDHHRFSPHAPDRTGSARIYHHDPHGHPFATDATKFALFCAAVAEALRGNIPGPPVDILHLHDWHAAFLLILRAFNDSGKHLQAIPTVYTIHNLSLQGIRPFGGTPSSLEEWYPGMTYDPALLQDPRWPNCLNPMAAGIRLANRVHAVSPSYAKEILLPSIPVEEYYGGEGLEKDLCAAQDEGRLVGILNGCSYPSRQQKPPTFPEAVSTLRQELRGWIARETTLSSAHFLADGRLDSISRHIGRPEMFLTAVSRLVSQKGALFCHSLNGRDTVLDEILIHLGDRGLFILLGAGDPVFEQFFRESAVRHPNFLFLNGYSDSCADILYRLGDLFLMPSSYEPCGISQMLAMRAGQPCLVNRVGGLKDTVRDGIDGFSFNGQGIDQQARHFFQEFYKARSLFLDDRERWGSIRKKAAAARFTWDDAVRSYDESLYDVLHAKDAS